MENSPVPLQIREKIVSQTCLLLVRHYRNLIEVGGVDSYGYNSRLFSHILHPEKYFVYAGQSVKVEPGADTHPEHVVPCAAMIKECRRLITAKSHSDEEIAEMLQRHWKVVDITRAEQKALDFELGYKSEMPPGWRFEDGDTFERLNRANITIKFLS